MAESKVLAKLRMKNGQRAIIIGAPESYQPILAKLPSGVELAPCLEGKFDFIHYFVTEKAELERRAAEIRPAMKPDCILWVSYPKGKSIPTNLNRDILRETLEERGFKAVAMVAIDEVWSALRLKAV